jgi:hypothetical protein
VANPSGSVPPFAARLTDNNITAAAWLASGVLVRATIQRAHEMMSSGSQGVSPGTVAASSGPLGLQDIVQQLSRRHLDGQSNAQLQSGEAAFEALKVTSTPGTAFTMQLQAEVINATLEVPLLVAPCYAGSIQSQMVPDATPALVTPTHRLPPAPAQPALWMPRVWMAWWCQRQARGAPTPGLSSNIHKCPNPLACVHTLGPREVVSTG